MLYPEIWKFGETNSSFQTNKTNDDKIFSEKRDQNNFYYNHLVSVIIPDSLRLPDNFSEKLFYCEYYKVLDLNLVYLMKKDFLLSFVKSGLLTHSGNTRIDCDNYKEIFPTDLIVLDVNKETYQQIGLERQLSHFSAKPKRYNNAQTSQCFIVTESVPKKYWLSSCTYGSNHYI